MGENMDTQPCGFAPAVLLVLAVFPLPYGYYTFLRICIFGASAYFAFREWDNESSVGLWVVAHLWWTRR